MRRNIFKLDIVAIMFYLALAISLLLVLNIHNIEQFITTRVSENNSPVAVDYSSVSAPLFNYLNKFSNLSLMLFWAIVGTIGYTLAIWIQTAFSSAFKEAKEANYVRPATLQATYWRSTIIKNLTVIGLLLSWVISLYVFAQILFPRLSKLLNQSLNSGTSLHRAGYAISAIILTAIGLYSIVNLGHLLRRSWHTVTQ